MKFDYSKLDVLIVDDDKNVCEVLSEYCQSLQIFRNIVVANDGVLASLKLKNQIFGLIILDINIPKKSGKTLIEELANSRSLNILEHVLVVSGELDKTLLAECVQYGIKNFIAKPFDSNVFQDKVKKIINHK